MSSETSRQIQNWKQSTHIHTRVPLPTSMCFSDRRTVYNSQAVSTTYPLWSTRVCRMETCKDHHSTCQVRQVSKYKTENSQHTFTLEYPCQHQCASQTAGRSITHKRFPQRTHYQTLVLYSGYVVETACELYTVLLSEKHIDVGRGTRVWMCVDCFQFCICLLVSLDMCYDDPCKFPFGRP